MDVGLRIVGQSVIYREIAGRRLCPQPWISASIFQPGREHVLVAMKQTISTQPRYPTIALLAVVVGLSGCVNLNTSNPNREIDLVYEPSLLSGERLFAEVITTDEIVDADIVGVSDEMAAYVEKNIGDARQSVARMTRLLKSLMRDDYFKASYDEDKTHTAEETFNSRSGNCLSYTNMFVALARHAGLNARFQIVEVPPNWDADLGFLIRYTHVNVLLKGVTFNRNQRQGISVDFNDVLPEPEYRQYEVSDAYAEALLYSNKGVREIRDGNPRRAFAYLKKALEITPNNPDIWLNLGTLYSKQTDYASAVDAFEVVLQIDSSNKSAIAGLARTHQILGNEDTAASYARRVRDYRERNAFYHFALARDEYDRSAYDKALESINTAISLKRGDARFHFMKGLTQDKLGQSAAAKKSFSRAKRYGRHDDMQRQYGSEQITTLRSARS